jgi:hypothetical protein
MMRRASPMPTHAAATGRRATHSENTGISECIHALVDNTNTRHRGGSAAQAVGRQEEFRMHHHAARLDNTKHHHAEVRPRP